MRARRQHDDGATTARRRRHDDDGTTATTARRRRGECITGAPQVHHRCITGASQPPQARSQSLPPQAPSQSLQPRKCPSQSLQPPRRPQSLITEAQNLSASQVPSRCSPPASLQRPDPHSPSLTRASLLSLPSDPYMDGKDSGLEDGEATTTRRRGGNGCPHSYAALTVAVPRAKCCHAIVATQLLPRNCCHRAALNVATQLLPRNCCRRAALKVATQL